MNISIRKPAQPATNDQKLLLNFLISLLTSAGATGLMGMYQYYTANSTINIGTMIIAGISIFAVSFGHGLYVYVPTHITEEIQALRDTVNDFQTPATVLSASVPATSVVIHAANVTVPTTPPVSTETAQMPEVTPVVNTPEAASDVTQKVTAVTKPIAVAG